MIDLNWGGIGGLRINNDGRRLLLKVIEDHALPLRHLIATTTSVPNSCIYTTRVMIKALRHFQVDCEAMVARVSVYNRVFMDFVDADGWPAPDRANALAKMGAHGIGLGWPDDTLEAGEVIGGNWAGHLIACATVKDQRSNLWLVDLTLDQLTRPKKNISMIPLVGYVPRSKIDDDRRLALMVNGSMVVYDFFPHETTYRGTPDWRDVSADAVEVAVNYIRGALTPYTTAPRVKPHTIQGETYQVTCPHCGMTHQHPITIGADDDDNIIKPPCKRGGYIVDWKQQEIDDHEN